MLLLCRFSRRLRLIHSSVYPITTLKISLSTFYFIMYDILELSSKILPELREIAKGRKIKRTESLKEQDMIYKILAQQAIEATEKK